MAVQSKPWAIASPTSMRKYLQIFCEYCVTSRRHFPSLSPKGNSIATMGWSYRKSPLAWPCLLTKEGHSEQGRTTRDGCAKTHSAQSLTIECGWRAIPIRDIGKC